MDVRADLLASFGRAKGSDDRKFGFMLVLHAVGILLKLHVKLGRAALVMIDTVQADPEEIHYTLIVLEANSMVGGSSVQRDAYVVFVDEVGGGRKQCT